MNILISLRKQKKVTQQDVADYLDISRQAYSNYETGKRSPDIEILIKLSDFFSVSIDYLVGKEKKPPSESQIDPMKDELWKKISHLDDIDTNKVDGFVSGLLSAEKYQSFTKIKNA